VAILCSRCRVQSGNPTHNDSDIMSCLVHFICSTSPQSMCTMQTHWAHTNVHRAQTTPLHASHCSTVKSTVILVPSSPSRMHPRVQPRQACTEQTQLHRVFIESLPSRRHSGSTSPPFQLASKASHRSAMIAMTFHSCHEANRQHKCCSGPVRHAHCWDAASI
jgi:hypothetical protein